MRLDEFVEGFERDPDERRRRLAEEKSYAITEYIEDVKQRFEETLQGDTLFGSTSPDVFVGRSTYPEVPTGILSPLGNEDAAAEFATSADWYRHGLDVGDVLGRRTGLLNSTRASTVHVEDTWDGFVGVQREVAIADEPVDVEVGLEERPELDVDLDDVTTPRGPRARARDATLAENPYVPRPVEKTLEDDDWRAEGAMTYLYRRGFDVYDINTVLSAGALGRGRNRRLVPTRWSITAVDDTIGRYLRGGLGHTDTVGRVEVWTNDYMGNRYWIVLAPGNWEFELVEMKAPESVWNPRREGYYLSSASEGYEGRSSYVQETAGAYYAARLGVLEHLSERDRQAKALVLREITDDFWAPVGVWQVREAVRHAFEGEHGEAETFHGAVGELLGRLPVSGETLRRKSNLVAGLQSSITDF